MLYGNLWRNEQKGVTHMNKDCTLRFLSGLGVGAGIALLLAPKSGDETRSLIANKTREGTDQLKHQATVLYDSAADVIEKGREEVARHKEGLKHAVEVGKQAYHESIT
jgi:gas vesicle protein